MISENKPVYIYALSTAMGDVGYIGQSVNPHLRFTHHKVDTKNDRFTEKGKWFNSNRDTMRIIILEECASFQEALQKEKYWIKYYLEAGATLYNKTYGNYTGGRQYELV